MKKVLFFAAAILAFSACKKDDDAPEPTPDFTPSPQEHSVLISNEGPFQSGTGTLSLFNISQNTMANEVFQDINSYPLGNIVQSSHKTGNKIYAMVNNAQKVEVMDYPEFTSTATIDGLGAVRYMVSHNDNGYISDWTLNGVHVVDLNSNAVSNTIATGSGPEHLLVHNEKLYVANSGGFAVNNTVSVIDLSTQTVTSQIEVADVPHSMAVDEAGNIRVLCRGHNDWSEPANSTAGALVTINPDSDEVTATLTFADNSQHPSHLVANADGSRLFFLRDGDIYRMEANATSLPDNALVEGTLYSLGYHPGAGLLLGGDAVDYTSQGLVLEYTEDGVQQNVNSTGVIPTHFLPL